MRSCHVLNKAAVLTGLAAPRGSLDGKPAYGLRYSRVYVKRDGRWQIVLFQQMRIARGE